MSEQYKYDLAISLNKENLKLAKEIVKHLNINKNRIFLYEERQKELHAEDAISNFSQIFKYGARMVLILYEEKWGTTPYTMIEETAIKERMLLQGYDFIVFLKVKPHKIPVWYPEFYIYLKQLDLPIKTIADYIEYKITKAGGTLEPLTIKEKINNLYNQIIRQKDIIKWETSSHANTDIRNAIAIFTINLNSFSNEFKGKFDVGAWNIPARNYYAIHCNQKLFLSIQFDIKDLYTHRNPKNLLEIVIFYTDLSQRNSEHDLPPHGQIIHLETYLYSVNMEGHVGWRSIKEWSNFITSDEIIDNYFNKYIDAIEKDFTIKKS